MANILKPIDPRNYMKYIQRNWTLDEGACFVHGYELKSGDYNTIGNEENPTPEAIKIKKMREEAYEATKQSELDWMQGTIRFRILCDWRYYFFNKYSENEETPRLRKSLTITVCAVILTRGYYLLKTFL